MLEQGASLAEACDSRVGNLEASSNQVHVGEYVTLALGLHMAGNLFLGSTGKCILLYSPTASQ